MAQLTVQVTDDLLDRLQLEAERLKLLLEGVVHQALLAFLEDDISAELILGHLCAAVRQALTGQHRLAYKVLDELEADEMGHTVAEDCEILALEVELR